MILLDAVYIHESGGKILLEYFISQLIAKGINNKYYFLFDSRLKSEVVDLLDNNHIRFIDPDEIKRKIFYDKYLGNITLTSVFCFGNVPPPIYIKRLSVYIFLQNSLLLDFKNSNYSLKRKLLFRMKREYLRFRNLKNYKWIVQSKLMKIKLWKKLNISLDNIYILPIFDLTRFTKKAKANHLNSNLKFFYNASGDEQKNHKVLFDAWEILQMKFQLFPELHLNIDYRFTDKIKKINSLRHNGILVLNHGICTREKLQDLYCSCDFYISPSLVESLGLPLIEAYSAGCRILASDLPYVNEVIKPSKVFDPKNPIALAKIIRDLVNNMEVQSPELVIENRINELFKLLSQ